MRYIEFFRKEDDNKLPQKIMVHESCISDFIFKAIDLERAIDRELKNGGLLLKAITDTCTPNQVRTIVEKHLNACDEAAKANE